MKKNMITVLVMGFVTLFSVGQERYPLTKVESPYRLIKGVVLVNDLRMQTTIVNHVEFKEVAAREVFGHSFYRFENILKGKNLNLSQVGKGLDWATFFLTNLQSKESWDPQVSLNAMRTAFRLDLAWIPAVVIDDQLMNDASIWLNFTNQGFGPVFGLAAVTRMR